MSRYTLACLLLVSIFAARPASADAGQAPSLITRISRAFAEREPTWKAERSLAQMGPSLPLAPYVTGVWTTDGYQISVTLLLLRSRAEATEMLVSLQGTKSVGPSRAIDGYGSRAFLLAYYVSAALEFQDANLLAEIHVCPDRSKSVEPIEPSDAVTAAVVGLARRAARLVDDAITGDVEVSACVNEFDGDRLPPPRSQDEALIRAAKTGCLPALEAALASGASPNARTEYDQTALAVATASGHRSVVRALLAAGATVRGENGQWSEAFAGALGEPSVYRPAELPAIHANQIAILDDLLKASAAAGAGRGPAMPPWLLFLVVRGDADGYLKAIIDRGADVNARTDGDRTALIVAILLTRAESAVVSVPILIAAGADVNARDESGKTALGHAKAQVVQSPEQDWNAVVRLLVDAGAKE